MTLRSLHEYPATPHGNVVDTYHGRKIPDPYRWLEDLDSAQTAHWIAEQNSLTESFLASVPQRRSIRERLEQVWNYERLSTPSREGCNYAFFKNSGLQNQPGSVCCSNF